MPLKGDLGVCVCVGGGLNTTNPTAQRPLVAAAAATGSNGAGSNGPGRNCAQSRGSNRSKRRRKRGVARVSREEATEAQHELEAALSSLSLAEAQQGSQHPALPPAAPNGRQPPLLVLVVVVVLLLLAPPAAVALPNESLGARS